VAVATPDTLSTRMAGPAIRAWQIAQALSAEHDVALVTTSTTDVSSDAFRVQHVDATGVAEIEAWCDVLVFQGFFAHFHPSLLRSSKVLVADVYDPLHLEQLEEAREQERPGWIQTVHVANAVLNEQLLRGDFFVCASERQRDFWLGQLAGLGRLNPAVYEHDPTLRSLIDVVPFGLPDEPPAKQRQVLKGVVPGIGVDDEVVLWGGGIWNWFDPLSLIRAIDKLRHRRPQVRLFFLGTHHPNPAIGEMAMARSARALADELALTGRHVFFNDGWVAYEERHEYLLEADLGISTHLDHVETAFAFRTRVLDYLWTSLPMVLTAGDALADLVERRDLGLTVPAGDVAALEHAVFTALDDGVRRDRWKANLAAVAPEFAWSRALEPLLAFCREPRRAPDLLDPATARLLDRRLARVHRRRRPLAEEVRAAVAHLRHGGPAEVVRRLRQRLR
jgi:glycosyltransferase involved in cell wall biosynthesis